jgi:hypothetical protein
MAGSNLQRLIQSDFGVGMQPDVARHLIDANAVFGIGNGLLDDDGLIYRRGGGTYKSDAAFGSALTWIWDGYVHAGQRTLVANNADFGVLDSNDTTIVNLGGAGLSAPAPARVIEGMAFIGGATSYIYGGSRKTANYTTGTVSVTNGSKVVTGSGTTWNTLVDSGMLFQRGNERVYVIDTVDSTTQVTLRDAYEGVTGSGIAYTFYPLYAITAADPYEQANLYAVAGNKLCRAVGDTVYVAGLDLTTGKSKPHSWAATDFERLSDGVTVLGLDSIGDVLMIFTTQGIWTVQNLAYNIVDALGNPQWRMDNISRDLTLWGNEGITAWQNSLIVPAIDGIYLVDPVSAPSQISHAIDNLYRSYVDAGYKPGRGTVYKQHFFLPILDANNITKDVLVARLDRPVRFRNTISFPWSQQNGHSAEASAFTTRVVSGQAPHLYIAGNNSAARIMSGDSWFTPGDAYKQEPNSTVHDLTVVTRDYMLQQLGKARARRLRLHYLLNDAASDDPHIKLDISVGKIRAGVTEWGHFNWGAASWFDADNAEFEEIDGQAPENDGSDPYTWHFAKWSRLVRFRIRSSGPASKLSLHNLEVFVAPAGTVRH